MNTKGQVLELLERNRGRSLSGEEMAGQLNVSRSAVWKAIGELRQEGYAIHAATRKGYCLLPENDRLSAQAIKAELLDFSLPDSASIQVFSSLPSTNQTAKELAVGGAAHGTVVLADTQTSGRGRYDRSFCSPPGGLYMSMILRPEKLRYESASLVTAYAAAAVCEAIEQTTGKLPGIKWVNDLYLNQKKVCGILTEAGLDFETGILDWVVVGIGVNVHTDDAQFPASLRGSVISLDPEKALPGLRSRLAAQVIRRLAQEEYPGEQEMLVKYKQRLLGLSREITVISPEGNSERALAVDLDGAGRLVVQRKDGTRTALSSGKYRIQLDDLIVNQSKEQVDN